MTDLFRNIGFICVGKKEMEEGNNTVWPTSPCPLFPSCFPHFLTPPGFPDMKEGIRWWKRFFFPPPSPRSAYLCLDLSPPLFPWSFFSLYCTLFPASPLFSRLASYSLHTLPREMMNNSKRWDEETKRCCAVACYCSISCSIFNPLSSSSHLCLLSRRLKNLSPLVSVSIPAHLYGPPPTTTSHEACSLLHCTSVASCLTRCLTQQLCEVGTAEILPEFNSVLVCWPVCPPLPVQSKLVHGLPWQPPDGKRYWLWRILNELLLFFVLLCQT